MALWDEKKSKSKSEIEIEICKTLMANRKGKEGNIKKGIRERGKSLW